MDFHSTYTKSSTRRTHIVETRPVANSRRPPTITGTPRPGSILICDNPRAPAVGPKRSDGFIISLHIAIIITYIITVYCCRFYRVSKKVESIIIRCLAPRRDVYDRRRRGGVVFNDIIAVILCISRRSAVIGSFYVSSARQMNSWAARLTARVCENARNSSRAFPCTIKTTTGLSTTGARS